MPAQTIVCCRQSEETATVRSRIGDVKAHVPIFVRKGSDGWLPITVPSASPFVPADGVEWLVSETDVNDCQRERSSAPSPAPSSNSR
jgi:hypothetical protein